MSIHRRIALLLLLALAATPFPIGAQKRFFQLTGKILQNTGKPFRYAVIFLFSSNTPYTTRTVADPGGDFKFKGLPPGLYTLVAAAPFAGEITRSVEIGGSFADEKGRIVANIKFDLATAIPPEHGVSTAALSVSSAARTEYRKAIGDLEKQKVDSAVKRLQRAVRIAPQFAAAWNYLGTISFQAGRYQEAEKYFREALQQDARAYDPLVNLGGALLALRRYQESLPVNAEAVKLRPNDPLAHSQLGQSYYYLGDLEKAETHLKQAKALDSGHFTYPQIMLAKLYRERRIYGSAADELEEFLKLHPESPTVAYVRKELAEIRTLMRQ